MTLLCSTAGDGVLTLEELIRAATTKMPNAPGFLTDEKLEGIRQELSKAVPELQNRENFVKSYKTIFGELHLAVQLELAVVVAQQKGSTRSTLLKGQMDRRLSTTAKGAPKSDGNDGSTSFKARARWAGLVRTTSRVAMKHTGPASPPAP